MARLGRLLLAFALVLTFAVAPSGAVRATGASGPIQLGGDDQNDHGSSIWIDHDANPATPDVVETVGGWRYYMVSLEVMLATEQRAGAINSIAVIGVDGSGTYSPGLTPNDGGASCTTAGIFEDTYCTVEVATAELDRRNGATAAPTVTYYRTAAEVDAFFEGIALGTTNVAVIFIPGDGGDNNLDDGLAENRVDSDPTVTTAMEQALTDAAPTLAAFVAAGGGLLSSGEDHYLSWLTVLLPGVMINDDDTTETIGMTAAGAALWSGTGGITDLTISSNWHHHFVGDIGALQVLGLGWEEPWVDADLDGMIDSGEASANMWRGLDGINGNADDAQTRVIIGGAAGTAALAPELPETNREGDAFMYWLSIGALLTAGAGLMLRGRKSASL